MSWVLWVSVLIEVRPLFCCIVHHRKRKKKKVCFELRIHSVTNGYNWISSRMTNLTLFLKYLLPHKDERIKTG